MTAAALIGTWADGLFIVDGDNRRHELPGQMVRGVARDGRGGALAIVDSHSLNRRASDGTWTTVATSEAELACILSVDDVIYAGTDDGAHLLRVSSDGEIHPVHGFENTPGRDSWFAGAMLVNGQLLGPPLGVRSLTMTADGSALLANIHVGGIARSTDGGSAWSPTIDINSDVHEVRAHPRRADVVIAAAATGLWMSRDGGATWTPEQSGLHASYCAAVAFSNDEIIVSASTDHFATQGALYRRSLGSDDALTRIAAGLPEWLGGIVDTGCIATLGASIAIADRGGNVYVSTDEGDTWERRASGLPTPSSVIIV
ncbi:MAG TPA: sialidase family protein [Gemmatimonadaceae bacterium]|jgi:photosystem II stability/assembly factor-like uncharacterized protein